MDVAVLAKYLNFAENREGDKAINNCRIAKLSNAYLMNENVMS
jgi:hypothetical protein